MEGHQDQIDPNRNQEFSYPRAATRPLNLLPEEHRELARQRREANSNVTVSALDLTILSLPSENFSRNYEQSLLGHREPIKNRTLVLQARTEPLRSNPQFESLRSTQENQAVGGNNGQLTYSSRPDIFQENLEHRSGPYRHLDPGALDYSYTHPGESITDNPYLQQDRTEHNQALHQVNQGRYFGYHNNGQSPEPFPEFNFDNQGASFGRFNNQEAGEPSTSLQQHSRGSDRGYTESHRRYQGQGFKQEEVHQAAASAASHTRNRGRGESVTELDDDSGWRTVTDIESRREEFDERSYDPFSGDTQGSRDSHEVGAHYYRQHSSSRRRRTSIKSRAGSRTSVSSSGINLKKLAKRRAKYFWGIIGRSAKSKPATSNPQGADAQQTSAYNGQVDILQTPLEAIGNRTFSATTGTGFCPPYKEGTSFVEVSHKTADYIKARASRSSAGNFVPPKAKRNFTDKFKFALKPSNWKPKKAKRRSISERPASGASPIRQQPSGLSTIDQKPQANPESPVDKDPISWQQFLLDSESQVCRDNLRPATPEPQARLSLEAERHHSGQSTPRELYGDPDPASRISAHYSYTGPPSDTHSPSSIRSPWYELEDGAELQVPRTRPRPETPTRRHTSTGSQHVREATSFDGHDQSSPTKKIGRLHDQSNTSDGVVHRSPSHTVGTYTATDLQTTTLTSGYVTHISELNPQLPRRVPSWYLSDTEEHYQHAVETNNETLQHIYEKCLDKEKKPEFKQNVDLQIAKDREAGAVEKEQILVQRAIAEVKRQTFVAAVESASREAGASPGDLPGIQRIASKSHKRLSRDLLRSKSQRGGRTTPAAQRLLRAQGLDANPAPISPLAHCQVAPDPRVPTSSRSSGPPAFSFTEPSVQHAQQVLGSQDGRRRDPALPVQSQELQAASRKKFGVSLKSVASRNSGAELSFGADLNTVDSRDQPGSKLFGVELKPVKAKDQQDSEVSFVSSRSGKQQQGENTESGHRTLSEDAYTHRNFRGIPEGRARLVSNESQQSRRLRDLPPTGDRVASNESQQNLRGPLTSSLKATRNTSVAQIAQKFESEGAGAAQDSTADKVTRDQAGARVQTKVPREFLSQSGENFNGNKSSLERDSQEKVSPQTSFQEPGQDPGQEQRDASGSGTSDVPAGLLQPGRLDPPRGRSSEAPPTSGSRIPRPVARLTPATGARRDLQQSEQRRVTAPSTNNQRHRGPEITVNPAPSQSRIQQPAVSARSVTGLASNLGSPDLRGQNSKGRKGPKSPFLGSHPQ